MRADRFFILLLVAGILSVVGQADTVAAVGKNRIVVVSSYNSEYLWSQETNEGLCAAFLQFGYLDNQEQVREYTHNDAVESSRAIIRKLWMDSKKKEGSKEEMVKVTRELTLIIKEFKPDLILLGDDNAANYIGNQFLDTEIAIVFWGVNNTPVKYGLVDSEEKPGHNVTGVYQTGYYVESMQLLGHIVPGIKSFAILSDDTSTGRSHQKKVESHVRRSDIPLELVEAVVTSDFEQWKNKALELQTKVDAFFVVQYYALKDAGGTLVPAEKVMEWYLTHITKPETGLGLFVKEGMLCAAEDAGYNQGFEAGRIAHDILANGVKPATYPPMPPKRGKFLVNKNRAKMLNITLTPEMGVEQIIE